LPAKSVAVESAGSGAVVASYPSLAWETVELMRGMTLMVKSDGGPRHSNHECMGTGAMSAIRLEGLDLNLLVDLDALLRERRVTRAARRVGLSQPAMSNVPVF
jgi:hypothetical protein